MARRRTLLWVPVVAVPALALAAACVDPTHDDQVTALGGEAPGVPPGPTHRPGQPCLVCHGTEGPASSRFALGGTVTELFKSTMPAVGANVQAEDITGSVVTAVTNAVGNFYVPASQWQPTFPVSIQVSLGPATNQMLTYIGRNGSCAACHQSQISPSSPGPIYVVTDESQLEPDGGTSP